MSRPTTFAGAESFTVDGQTRYATPEAKAAIWDGYVAAGLPYRHYSTSASVHLHVGGSLTERAVTGYETLGGTKFDDSPNYGGGHVKGWATDTSGPGGSNVFFGRFDAQVVAHGQPSKIWWQLLVNDTANLAELEGHADTVLAGIKSRCPNSTIYVSAMAPYAADATSCKAIWDQYTDLSADLYDKWIVDEERFLPGPVMQDLTAAMLVGATGCHQGPTGQAAHGQRLLDFFG